MNKEINIELRELRIEDLDDYLYWFHPSREFHKFNGPYFKQKTEDELNEYIEELKHKLGNREKNVLGNKKVISDKENDGLIGQVNWYWKSEETYWMEIGIVIFNENYWGLGLGYKALKLWIDETFIENPQIIRLGLTTWSGNERMMSLAEKLGFKKEAVYRQARIVDGKYYDSISYGILKNEWHSNL